MATGRILKTQISLSEQVNDLSLKAALLYTWMIPHTDDWGRMTGSSRKIKAMVVPMRDDYTSTDVESCLEEMVERRLIARYRVGGEPYIQFPTFDQHQSGLHKRTTSKFPSLDQSDSEESGASKEIPKAAAPLDEQGSCDDLPGNSWKFPASRACAEQNRTGTEQEQKEREIRAQDEKTGAEEKGDIPTSAPAPEFDAEFKRCTAVAILLRDAGVKITSMNPDLVEWIRQDVTDRELTDAVERARAKKPEDDIPAGYLNPIVRQVIDERGRRNAKTPTAGKQTSGSSTTSSGAKRGHYERQQAKAQPTDGNSGFAAKYAGIIGNTEPA